MSIFSEKEFIEKIESMTDVSRSVRYVSEYCVEKGDCCEAIVRVWFDQLKKADTEKKLVLLYLANDVIQVSKQNNSEYIGEFQKYFYDVFSHIGKSLVQTNVIVFKKINHILNIWRERCIYDVYIINFWRFCLLNNVNGGRSGHQNKFIIKFIKELDNAASIDIDIREKISSIPPEFHSPQTPLTLKDATEIKEFHQKASGAFKLVTKYNKHLEFEMGTRSYLSHILKDYEKTQHDLQAENMKCLQESQEMLKKMKNYKKMLKNHHKCLPDITQLPSGSELEPLPSTIDLFSHSNKK